MNAVKTTPETKIVTFGCRMNTYESEVIRGKAREAGLDGAIIVNTCTVTAEADRQARQTVRRLKRENPDAKIIVTGCGAQVNPKAWADMEEVDRVLGNEEKMLAGSYRPDDATPLLVTDIADARETAAHLLSGFEERTRAFVQVQQGCDHDCTFCIIPTARGPNRSVPLGRIVDQARELVLSGYKEIILTGVDILSYGSDLPGRPTFTETLRRLLDQVPDIVRMRLTSLDPAVIDDKLIALLGAEERLMPHVHLSVQAGDDMILKRMKRRHTRAQVIDLCERIKDAKPGVALGADLITGFPTETDAMAANTLALVEETGLSHLHVFPYSPREGTPAARMPQVSGAKAKARASDLRKAGETNMTAFKQGRVGRTAEVLVEKPGFGHSEHYLPVCLPETFETGTVARVTLTGIDDDGILKGESA